jgi:predicted  nucleic acid-binding Zn-ribbon protein
MPCHQNRTPSEMLHLLVELQDLDLMIREAAVQEEKNLGFQIEDVSKLQEARENLADELSPEVLKLYERIMERFDRAVVPVHRGICLGCFMSLPTALAQTVKRHQGIRVCENCGRILYWLDE